MTAVVRGERIAWRVFGKERQKIFFLKMWGRLADIEGEQGKGDSEVNRTLLYLIRESDHDLRIEQYLRRQGYSRQNLTELKKMPDSVQVNGENCILKKQLSAGDELVVRIQETDCSEKIPPVNLPLHIIYEDEDILVVNKPAGLPMHPSMKNYHYSLANAIAWYYQQQEKPFVFRCANRLDRDTSGLTVIAKHMLSANILSAMGYRHEARREYLAVVRGKVVPDSGTIDAPLSRREGSIIERKVDFEHGERAVTHYKVIEEKNGHSLVSLHLETGRTHQIRIHLKYLGFPLVGDYLYNPDMEYISRQALHSYRLGFRHPITKERMDFTAPLPRDMQNAFGWQNCVHEN